MDFITAVLLILLGFIIYHAIKTDWKAMYKTVLAYLFSVSLVISVPYGIVKIMVPEAIEAEQAIVKEVQEWMS
jgi:hypothetical protein